MNKIFKYELKPGSTNSVQSIALPINSEILCITTLQNVPVMYVKVNPDRTTLRKVIYTYGTGDMMNNPAGKYLGTYQIYNSKNIPEVYHVFESTY